MKFVRFQLKRFCIVLTFLVFLYGILSLKNYHRNDPGCVNSPEMIKEMDELLGFMLEPLKALNITYFICYDTLWGALKNKGPFPWHSVLQLCVLNKEISAIDEGFFARTFKRYGLSLNYNSAAGTYKVQKFDKTEPVATMTVFEEDPITGQMRRIGWIHRMLPPNACEELNCFPPDLIAKPLSVIKFGKHSVPVPRDGMEIQKYLFPYSWWKEVSPPDC